MEVFSQARKLKKIKLLCAEHYAFDGDHEDPELDVEEASYILLKFYRRAPVCYGLRYNFDFSCFCGFSTKTGQNESAEPIHFFSMWKTATNQPNFSNPLGFGQLEHVLIFLFKVPGEVDDPDPENGY